MVGDSPLPDKHPSDDVSALFAERDDSATAYYLSICIQGVHTDALVDTGASITLISNKYFKAIPNLKMDSSPPFSVEGVIAGSQLDVLGQVNLPIKLCNFISKLHPIVIQCVHVKVTKSKRILNYVNFCFFSILTILKDRISLDIY